MKIINQQDSEYGGWTLGATSYSVNRFGCAAVVTSQATNKTLREIVDNNDGFDKNGFIKWPVFGTVKDLQFYNEATPLEKVAGFIHDGYPVILDTRFNQVDSLDNEHFVLAIAVNKEGTDFEILDPWFGDKVWFSKRYGDPAIWIFESIVYDSRLLPVDGKTMPVDVETFSMLVHGSDQWDQTWKYLELAGEPASGNFETVRRVIAGYKGRMSELQISAAKWETEAGNQKELAGRQTARVTELTEKAAEAQTEYLKKQEQYDTEIKKLNTDLDQMGKEKGRLAIALSACQAKPTELTIKNKNLIIKLIDGIKVALDKIKAILKL